MVTHPSDKYSFDTHPEEAIMAPSPAFTPEEQPVNDAWIAHLRAESLLVRRNPITILEESAS
jgi:hypothetical protein